MGAEIDENLCLGVGCRGKGFFAKVSGCVEPTVAWALPTGCFLENKGRLKACVQVSDDLSYFRGHSPRYQLNTVGNTVLFDRVSLDVAQ